jgi:hypothetical protein
MKIAVTKLLGQDSPWPRPTMGSRGASWFCCCGTRFLVSGPLHHGWEDKLEDAIELHEWEAHTHQ